ncbi:MAG: hypothetical protein HRT38_20485, partial [Alteromonadaceae bacterium]|nr:hypothetical protein [Alteromonadaceae bacterium]
ILWVATSDGLNKFDKNKEVFTRYYHEPSNSVSLSHSLIRTLHVVKNKDKINDTNQYAKNTLWVGTEKGLGIFDIQTESFTAINPESSSIDISVTRIRQDKNHHLLIGTLSGLYQYDLKNKKFIVLSNEKTLANKKNYRLFNSDNIRAMLIDSSGLLWLANFDSGLVKIDSKPAVFENRSDYVTKNGSVLNLPPVLATYVDREKVLWLVTKEAIFYKNNKTGFIIRFMFPAKFTDIDLGAIDENKSGELWFGGQSGLYKIDKKRKRITVQNKLLEKIKIKNINTIMFDNNDRLWIGTVHSGLIRIDESHKNLITIYNADGNASGSLNSNNIKSIYQDNFNRIWVGTNGGGLARLDPGNKEFVKYVHQSNFKNSISDNVITTIYQTKDGDIWIGTKRSLDRYNPDNDIFEHFDVAYGLANVNIKAMVEDDFGALWLSTNAGISQLGNTRKRFINYDYNHELQEVNFVYRSVSKGKNGSVFFGGHSGITKVTPAQAELNKHIPAVVITDVWIDNELSNQHLSDDKKLINLNFDIKNIKFRFAALDFKEPGNNMYSFRLVGFDDEWSQASNLRTASYTNLVPDT